MNIANWFLFCKHLNDNWQYSVPLKLMCVMREVEVEEGTYLRERPPIPCHTHTHMEHQEIHQLSGSMPQSHPHEQQPAPNFPFVCITHSRTHTYKIAGLPATHSHY